MRAARRIIVEVFRLAVVGADGGVPVRDQRLVVLSDGREGPACPKWVSETKNWVMEASKDGGSCTRRHSGISRSCAGLGESSWGSSTGGEHYGARADRQGRKRGSTEFHNLIRLITISLILIRLIVRAVGSGGGHGSPSVARDFPVGRTAASRRSIRAARSHALRLTESRRIVSAVHSHDGMQEADGMRGAARDLAGHDLGVPVCTVRPCVHRRGARVTSNHATRELVRDWPAPIRWPRFEVSASSVA
jgi:hypothetical protein